MSVWDDIADSREEAENLKLRAALIRAIRDRIDGAGWSQSIAAQNLGLTQPRVSDLYRGKISKFSLDALVEIASKLGIHVRVEVDVDTVLSAWCRRRFTIPRKSETKCSCSGNFATRETPTITTLNFGTLWDHTLCAMLNDLRAMHAMHAHESAASCQRPAKMRHRYFWGSSGRKFKSCQPDRCFRSSEAVSEKFEAAFSLPGGGYVRQPVRQPAAVTVPTLR